MLMRTPHLSLAEYAERARDIEMAHTMTSFFAEAVPRDPASFIAYLLQTHDSIFRFGAPDIAGRFRHEGEDTQFGGDATHRLVGAPPAEIEERLRRLVVSVPMDDFMYMERETFVEHCALFLERFFRIHPFVDGNGRVGRFVLDSFARFDVYGREFRAFDTSPAGRRRYVKALQFAHKYAVDSEHPMYVRIADPMRHLRAYLLEHLTEIPPLLVDEPPDDYYPDPDADPFYDYGHDPLDEPPEDLLLHELAEHDKRKKE